MRLAIDSPPVGQDFGGCFGLGRNAASRPLHQALCRVARHQAGTVPWGQTIELRERLYGLRKRRRPGSHSVVGVRLRCCGCRPVSSRSSRAARIARVMQLTPKMPDRGSPADELHPCLWWLVPFLTPSQLSPLNNARSWSSLCSPSFSPNCHLAGPAPAALHHKLARTPTALDSFLYNPFDSFRRPLVTFAPGAASCAWPRQRQACRRRKDYNKAGEGKSRSAQQSHDRTDPDPG